MKKILHISDIHVGNTSSEENFRKLILQISKKLIPASDYIIVITGDTVNNANITEDLQKASNIIAELRNYGFKVLIVPGNHDYGSGNIANKKFVPIFKKYFWTNSSLEYPKVDVIDDMLFIGLDSMQDELHDFDRFLAQGELGKTQLDRLSLLINNPQNAQKKKIVYLHHHPIKTALGLSLKDRKNLCKIIDGKIDVLLFGHMHNDEATEQDWKILTDLKIPRIYNSGTATYTKNNKGWHTIIDLSKSPDMDYNAKLL